MSRDRNARNFADPLKWRVRFNDVATDEILRKRAGNQGTLTRLHVYSAIMMLTAFQVGTLDPLDALSNAEPEVELFSPRRVSWVNAIPKAFQAQDMA